MSPAPVRRARRRDGAFGRRAQRSEWPLPNLRWWRELIIIAAFYGIYTLVRDLHATSGGLREATQDALQLVGLERDLDVFHEQWLQHQVIHWRLFVEFWNSYYGTVHFIAVVVVLLLLFYRHPDRYPMWRNTLALTTALALIGFIFYPVLPPRLLPPGFGFVDTLSTFPGVWDFSHGAVASASNQYAAMPSLHTAWSTWCALAVMPMIRSRWGRGMVALYPVATVFCIVVTGNHYFVDAAGGVVTLLLGYGLARLMTGAVAYRRWLRRALPALPSSTAAAERQSAGARPSSCQ